ncbi:MAG: baseplate J/gp47 family protein, partial [Treponema sp.]|nr:baseplate J/gp47 family protein [Treponema sp.]
RIKSRWRGQVLGDTKEVYRFHAEEVPGVKAARVVRTPRGPGTCDVVVAAENGRPSEELLGAVRKNLHAHELMAFKVEVREPGILPVEVRVEYSGDASANEVALVAERYVRGLGIGGRLRIADLYGLYRPLGLATVEILSPERDVQPNEDTVIEAEVTAEEIG